MHDQIRSILAFHIVVAVLCALAFWPPLFSTKGGRFHVLIGKAYTILLTLMTGTALTVTVMSFLDAASAAARPGTGMLLDPYRHDAALYRAHLLLLAFVAIGAVQAMVFGMQALKARPSRVAATVHGSLGLAGGALIVQGIHFASLPMAAIGVVGAALGAFFARRAARASLALRIPDHLTGLVLSGVLSYSAIAIVVANRMMPAFFHGPYGIVIWVLPTLIGLPAIVWMRRHHADTR